MIDIARLKETAGLHGFWYVMSPYSKHPDGPAAAFQQACIAAGWLMDRGVRIFSPIAHSHSIAIHAGIDSLSHEIWMPADAPLMHAAVGGIVAMLPGWRDSFGVAAELSYFSTAEKPVLHLHWPLEQI